MKLSVVATLYQSAAHITEFYQRTTAAAQKLAGDDYELIFVNDGSSDNSLDLAVQLTKQDTHVAVVELSRNFGHHKAMMTGLAHAKGDQIFLIDSDLEEEPEWLNLFSDEMSKQKSDVVYGIQEKRKGKLFERWSGHGFYYLFKKLTGLALPENMVTARLMTSDYVDALLCHQEREVFIVGLWHITGFNQSPQKITKKHTSKTTYTFRKKMNLFIDSITSFSNAPLIGIFYFGVLVSMLSCFYISGLLIKWLFFAKPLTGWTSLISSIWLLGGLIISFIGLIGIYLAKIFSETKQRPYTLVRQVYTYARDES